MHLRLRFQNRGKPRTAGLCGRAVGACDCGPLSCALIERPSPLEKSSCKVRFFAQNRSRKYRQKVAVTTLFQTAFHRVFQLLAQTPHACFHRQKWVHTRLSEKDRTQGHTRRNRGAFPPSSTVRLCAACEIPFIPPCFYIHTFPGSLWPPLSATVLSQTIFHRVFQLLSQMAHVCFRGRKRVTHSAFGERSHTTAHTAKQGVFQMGCYYYPRTVSHVSETLRGQGVERQTAPVPCERDRSCFFVTSWSVPGTRRSGLSCRWRWGRSGRRPRRW